MASYLELCANCTWFCSNFQASSINGNDIIILIFLWPTQGCRDLVAMTWPIFNATNCISLSSTFNKTLIVLMPSDQSFVDYIYIGNFLREAFKNKNKKCGFFPHWGWGGSTPNPHFFKSVDFQGGWGVLGPISTLFCPILFFLKNFVLFYPVFVGWKVIFRVKLKKNFFHPKCVSTL